MTLPAKVLIANRGEVAVRIIRTLRRMGIASVVVQHAVDAGSAAEREADEAVVIRGTPPITAYLDINQIIDACRRTSADAIHPGFGFLSEKAAFAEATAAAGLTFIGPPPGAMRAMGDKIESKRLAKLAGVPTVPGSAGAVQTVKEALTVAESVGYPVLLKASAGGGGKGMRIANNPQECREAWELAGREAEAAFGDGRVFVERYIEKPRHIEIQVLGDQHGNIVHLGERECSIQRRYQKVIEEAPSTLIDSETRAAMGRQACQLAASVNYYSAGTVEMVVDQRRNFYFLEMNTRLQVEHPVTEAVTGIDIVEQQLRVAAGERLQFAQSDVSLRGHAIEARIYAEDVEAGYLPATGRLHRVRFPAGPGVRVDHGVIEGREITAAFDPMIAKVIAHGATRAEAIERLRQALRATILLGPVTNTDFLERVLGHPAFASGDTHTGFLAQHREALKPRKPSVEEERVLIAAAALSSIDFDPRFQPPFPLTEIGHWRP